MKKIVESHWFKSRTQINKLFQRNRIESLLQIEDFFIVFFKSSFYEWSKCFSIYRFWFNHTWIYNSTYLRKTFQLLSIWHEFSHLSFYFQFRHNDQFIKAIFFRWKFAQQQHFSLILTIMKLVWKFSSMRFLQWHFITFLRSMMFVRYVLKFFD